MKDQKSIILKGEDFEGWYDRGSSGNSAYDPKNACPSNGFTEADQIRYRPWGVQIRPGYDDFTIGFSPAIGDIIQVSPYQTNWWPGAQLIDPTHIGPVSGHLVITFDSGTGTSYVYDSNSAVPSTAIYTSTFGYTEANYLSFVLLDGFIAFTLHNYSQSTISSPWQIYKLGDAASRDNGGLGPVIAGIGIASSGTAGNVTQGVHAFGVVLQSNTGHFTSLDHGYLPINSAFYTIANANEQVTVVGLPVLPNVLYPGMEKAFVLASRVIPSSSGDVRDYELFFVDGAETTTGTVTFDFTDESLIDSADYLYDQENLISGQLGFTLYANRLVMWGGGIGVALFSDLVGNSTLKISEINRYESVSLSHGRLPVNPDDGSYGIYNCYEYQGLLIIQKGNKTFVTRDNGADPNTWNVDILDGSIGGVLEGVSKSLDTIGNTKTDFTINVSKSGVQLFDGKFNQTPLSWKIERYWSEVVQGPSITYPDYFRYKVIDIPTAQLFIIPVTDNSDTVFLACDYSRGLDYRTVRWSRWIFEDINILYAALKDPTELIFCTGTNEVFTMNIGTHDVEYISDNGGTISNGILTTGELRLDQDLNRYHFAQVRIRGALDGVTGLAWYSDDDSTSAAIINPLKTIPADIYIVPINKDNYFPRFKIEFQGGPVDEEIAEFKLKQINFYATIEAINIIG